MNQIPNIEEWKTGVEEEVEELIDALGVTEHRAIGFVKVIPTHSLRQLLIGHHQQLQSLHTSLVAAVEGKKYIEPQSQRAINYNRGIDDTLTIINSIFKE